jgi:hypothetical protein
MSTSTGVAVDLILLLGLLVAAPFWLVCLFQVMKWLHKAEGEIKPGLHLADSRPLLLGILGRTAVLVQPEMLTEKGLAARTATMLWLRRILLTSAILVTLIVLKELMHPEPMQKRGQLASSSALISDASA